MEVIKREIEFPKETLELGECIGNVMKSIGIALKDGWQTGQDMPVILAASFTELVKAIEGVQNMPSEWKESYIKATLSLINPIALGIEEVLKSR